MKSLLFCFAIFLALSTMAQQSLPVYDATKEKKYDKDWLITPITTKAQVYRSNDEKEIILFNGLLKRSFRIQPNLACVDYRNMSTGQQLLRAVKPEAIDYN